VEVENLWAQELRGDPASLTLEGKAQENRSAEYNIHAVHALLTRFPTIPTQHVRKAFLKSDSLKQALERLASFSGQELKRGRMVMKTPPCPIPPDLLRELAVAPHLQDMQHELEHRRQQRSMNVAKLKQDGSLRTCACCFDDELLEEEALVCNAIPCHFFCRPCVKNAALNFFGSGLFAQNFFVAAQSSGSGSSSSGSSRSGEPPPSGSASQLHLAILKCLDTSVCDGCFSDVMLRRALPPKDYKRYSSRSTGLQAVASGIKNLVPCPACDFMIEMADHNDGIIQCLSPECGQVSCRLCGGADHRPLRCSEVEKDAELKLRTFLEEQLTDASARHCPGCNKIFEKTEGCNKIPCQCGTKFCYLCGEILDDTRSYDHFKDGARGGGINASNSRCVVFGEPTWASTSAELRRGQTETALQEYLEAHPELQGLGGERIRAVRRRVGLTEEPPRKRLRLASSWLYGSRCTMQ